MLQQEKPEDYVIATGVQYSVRDFIRRAAKKLGLDLEFTGEGLQERAIIAAISGSNASALSVGQTIMRIDPRYYRPAEVDSLLGDSSKAAVKLGWLPEISLDNLITEMIDHDLDKAKQAALLKKYGYTYKGN